MSRKDNAMFKVNELRKVHLSEEYEELVFKFKNKLIAKEIILILVVFSIVLLLTHIMTYAFLNPESVDNMTIFIIISFAIIILMLFFMKNILKKILFLGKTNYVKAEFGKIRNKNDYTGDTFRRISIYFGEKSCYIPNVLCHNTTYLNLRNDNDVLVVSFDNKTAYCINYKGYKFNYKKIKAKQLDCVDIGDFNKDDIKTYAKGSLFWQIVRIIVLVGVVWINFPTSINVFSGIVLLVFLIIIYMQILKCFYFYGAVVYGKYKKAEYGVVIDKIFKIVKDEDGGSSYPVYTVKVEFPNKCINDITYISDIKCEKDIYHKLEVGSKALVVSIDNSKLILLNPVE